MRSRAVSRPSAWSFSIRSLPREQDFLLAPPQLFDGFLGVRSVASLAL